MNATQQTQRKRITTTMQGNAARPGRHEADALHLSEAIETGCSYFITEDKRFTQKRRELSAVMPPTLQIVTLVEFFEILDGFGNCTLA